MPDPGSPFRLRAVALPDAGASLPAGLSLRGVAAEIEAAFPRRSHPAADPREPAARVRAHAAAPGRVSLSLMGVVAAAALGGLAAGTVLPRPAPATDPALTMAAPAFAAPPAAAPAPAASVDRATVRWTSVPPPGPAAEEAQPRAEPARKAPARRAATKARPAAACAGSAARSRWCAYRAVLAADGRLRQAYARAVRAGASYDELVAQRRRWDRLRHRASRDPDYVVERYGDIARALERAGRRARS